MGKKKGKKKKKKGKKEDGPKKPSEKEVLEAKVTDLDSDLASASKDLDDLGSILGSWKERLQEAADSEAACVSHLRRNLEARTEEGVAIEGRLERLRSAKERVEQRAEELEGNLDAEREERRNVFLQQQTEVEDKLSRLEERRQRRSGQLSQLKKLEEALEARTSSELCKDRGEDMKEVAELLRRRDKFVDLVDGIASDHKEVFNIQLPVYATEQLRDNIRLRTVCQEAAESLLSTQDRNSRLRELQDSLQVELDTQDSADSKQESLMKTVGNRLDEVLRGVDVHRPVIREYLVVMKEEIGTMTKFMESVQDETEGVLEMLEDQDRYRKTLERGIAKADDENGLLVSKILRACRVFKGRVCEIEDADRVDVDTDVLQQIRMILQDE